MSNGCVDFCSDSVCAGVDEAGRGAIAGPVVAAAVVLPAHINLVFEDSKKLSPIRRVQLYKELKKNKADIGIGLASPREIESFNIHKATLLSMERALEKLKIEPNMVKVDGMFCPEFKGQIHAIPKGDQIFQVISAASIVAKVFRDYLMLRLGRIFPQYGFSYHKGYPTIGHKTAIENCGVLSCHRKSFEPIRSLLNKY